MWVGCDPSPVLSVRRALLFGYRGVSGKDRTYANTHLGRTCNLFCEAKSSSRWARLPIDVGKWAISFIDMLSLWREDSFPISPFKEIIKLLSRFDCVRRRKIPISSGRWMSLFLLRYSVTNAVLVCTRLSGNSVSLFADTFKVFNAVVPARDRCEVSKLKFSRGSKIFKRTYRIWEHCEFVIL